MAVRGSGGQARRLSYDLQGFTMVEIAIALAVIGFALVAIIGVLPSGLEVQKDNREETIINQDATYFMDAIRSGARGADDLTNYVFAITNFWSLYDTNTTPWTPRNVANVDGYKRSGSDVTSIPGSPFFPLTNGYRIIGLLGRPKYEYAGGTDYRSNYIVAYVRALSGPASEKFPQRDTNVQDLAFSYRFVSEIVTLPLPTPDVNNPFTNTAYAKNLRENLHEVRLLFRWPLFPNGNTGNGRQLYRSQVGGQLTNIVDSKHPFYFFEPSIFMAKP
jgi:prepilin-type N-terminal cleavage/methylation domain-containing protein